MATVRIEFETNNAAFVDDDAGGALYAAELDRLLHEAREAILECTTPWTLLDSNGNTVGKVTVTE
jgi:hypothetical protein